MHFLWIPIWMQFPRMSGCSNLLMEHHYLLLRAYLPVTLLNLNIHPVFYMDHLIIIEKTLGFSKGLTLMKHFPLFITLTCHQGRPPWGCTYLWPHKLVAPYGSQETKPATAKWFNPYANWSSPCDKTRCFNSYNKIKIYLTQYQPRLSIGKSIQPLQPSHVVKHGGSMCNYW